jgi:hypothetical protein
MKSNTFLGSTLIQFLSMAVLLIASGHVVTGSSLFLAAQDQTLKGEDIVSTTSGTPSTTSPVQQTNPEQKHKRTLSSKIVRFMFDRFLGASSTRDYSHEKDSHGDSVRDEDTTMLTDSSCAQSAAKIAKDHPFPITCVGDNDENYEASENYNGYENDHSSLPRQSFNCSFDNDDSDSVEAYEHEVSRIPSSQIEHNTSANEDEFPLDREPSTLSLSSMVSRQSSSSCHTTLTVDSLYDELKGHLESGKDEKAFKRLLVTDAMSDLTLNDFVTLIGTGIQKETSQSLLTAFVRSAALPYITSLRGDSYIRLLGLLAHPSVPSELFKEALAISSFPMAQVELDLLLCRMEEYAMADDSMAIAEQKDVLPSLKRMNELHERVLLLAAFSVQYSVAIEKYPEEKGYCTFECSLREKELCAMYRSVGLLESRGNETVRRRLAEELDFAVNHLQLPCEIFLRRIDALAQFSGIEGTDLRGDDLDAYPFLKTLLLGLEEAQSTEASPGTEDKAQYPSILGHFHNAVAVAMRKKLALLPGQLDEN